MELKLKQFVHSKFCFDCDVCCRFNEVNSVWSPVLADADIKDLPKDLINQENKFRLKPYKDMYVCPCFEPGDNKCRMYQDRPFDCKLYPFLLAKKDNKIFLGFDTKCPFLKDKEDSKEFKVFVKYLLGFLNQDDVKNMIKNNPQIICDYKDDIVFLEELDLSRTS